MGPFSPDSVEAAQMAEYRALTVRHLKVEEALDALARIGSPAHSESIVALVGPTGVGKSLLMRRFIEHVNKSYAAEMAADCAMVPAVVIELPTPIAGDFNWKDTGNGVTLQLECAAHDGALVKAMIEALGAR